MKSKVNVQYVGFESKAQARLYTFLVHQESGTREFTLSIFNEAFSSRRISFQDAPDLCSAKIHRELAAFANDPPESQYRVSEIELEEYQRTHAPRSTSRFQRQTAARTSETERIDRQAMGERR